MHHLGWKQWKTKQLVKNKWDCLNYGGEWIRPDLNFDTLNRSFTTLMTISSTEGWTQVLWSTTDAVDIDAEPVRDSRKYFGPVFQIVILFIISILFLNLFIGVVTDTFNR